MIRDPVVREAAERVVAEGLRRRYELTQLLCGFPVETFPGLLGLLAAAIPPPSIAAVRTPASVERTAAANDEAVALVFTTFARAELRVL